MAPKRKVIKIGSQLGITLPRSLVRAEGWFAGDIITVFHQGGNLVIVNDSRRLAKFSRIPRGRGEERLAVDAR